MAKLLFCVLRFDFQAGEEENLWTGWRAAPRHLPSPPPASPGRRQCLTPKRFNVTKGGRGRSPIFSPSLVAYKAVLITPAKSHLRFWAVREGLKP